MEKKKKCNRGSKWWLVSVHLWVTGSLVAFSVRNPSQHSPVPKALLMVWTQEQTCLCVRKEPQNCRRDTWACQGCSAGVAVTGRHTLLTGPASPPKWYFPNRVRTTKCRNQNADSCVPPLMFWSGVGSKNLQVVWCFDVLRSTFKESLSFSWRTVEAVTSANACPVPCRWQSQQLLILYSTPCRAETTQFMLCRNHLHT